MTSGHTRSRPAEVLCTECDSLGHEPRNVAADGFASVAMRLTVRAVHSPDGAVMRSHRGGGAPAAPGRVTAGQFKVALWAWGSATDAARHSGVGAPGGRPAGPGRHLGQDGRRILLAGVVEDPGQELGPFPRRSPAPLLVEERVPLHSGQVLLNESKHLAFLVREVIQHDSRQELGWRRQVTATA